MTAKSPSALQALENARRLRALPPSRPKDAKPAMSPCRRCLAPSSCIRHTYCWRERHGIDGSTPREPVKVTPPIVDFTATLPRPRPIGSGRGRPRRDVIHV